MTTIIILILIVPIGGSKFDSQGNDQPQVSDNTDLTYSNSIGIEFVLIPAGSFIMGSIKEYSEEELYPEHPQHKVTISKSFYLSKYPVTVGEFRQFVNTTSYETDGEKADGSWVWSEDKWQQKEDASWENPYFLQSEKNPVVCVSWNDAMAFVEWLKLSESKSYRLPTEAEFEYALRAGTTTTYFFGNDTIDYAKYGWPQGVTSQGFSSHPVGAKLPNPWGLYDMVGNSWQWCSDWYQKKYDSSSLNTDPQGPLRGKYRVNRGGMGDDVTGWSSTTRDALPPNSDYSNQTFRIVLSISE